MWVKVATKAFQKISQIIQNYKIKYSRPYTKHVLDVLECFGSLYQHCFIYLVASPSVSLR